MSEQKRNDSARVQLLEHHLRALIDVCRQQEAENPFDRPWESEYQEILAAAEQVSGYEPGTNVMALGA